MSKATEQTITPIAIDETTTPTFEIRGGTALCTIKTMNGETVLHSMSIAWMMTMVDAAAAAMNRDLARTLAYIKGR